MINKKSFIPLVTVLTLGASSLNADANLSTAPKTFDPFVEMQKMQQEMDSFFNNFHQKMRMESAFSKFKPLNPMIGFKENQLAIDLEDKGEYYELKANIPGADKQKIDISTKDGVLKIEAKTEKISEKKEDNKYLKQERYVGSYTRIMTLPKNANEAKLKDTYKDGVLTIIIEKKKK